ncbi:PspC domain-containing protein [Candidatus Falkowbacteria bacterium]|jgi:phage shock protein C|nr:PspC domain-containing protein [Candidatus Falkowbacteria bacterium]
MVNFKNKLLLKKITTMEPTRHLYRSRTNTVIAGVSGGLGKYFALDPIVIRILFLVLALFAAGGLIAYIILWIVIPLEPYDVYYNSSRYGSASPQGSGGSGAGFADRDKTNTEFENTILNPDEEMKKRDNDYKSGNEGSLIAGIILITLGGLFLAAQFIPRINFGDLWPVLLIVVGLLIIFSRSREGRR